MKKCIDQEQLSLFFNEKSFKIDTQKLSQILEKLNFEHTFKGSCEFEKFLKKYNLLYEEFLEFISY